MDEKRTNLEVIAPTVEEAVARGLADLGLPEDAVDIEILDTGTRGLFGLGTRQARVRLSIKVEGKGSKAPTIAPVETGETETPHKESLERAAQVPETAMYDEDSEVQLEPDLEDRRQAELETARHVVEDLVDRMNVQARITAEYGEPDEPEQRPPLIVNIQGKDLSLLIGPHAETLNALQYIAGLIVGKQLGHSLPLVVDVEGYRQRRSKEVRLLARRMAEQAVRTGRRQYLEPMPANERRLVHIELRDHPDVKTESMGEEPRRKVTVVLKQ